MPKKSGYSNKEMSGGFNLTGSKGGEGGRVTGSTKEMSGGYSLVGGMSGGMSGGSKMASKGGMKGGGSKKKSGMGGY